MPFINDVIDSNKLKNLAAASSEPLQPRANKKSRLGISRFTFDPERVMQKLRSRIIGQDAVLAEIATMLNIVKADIGDTQRPLYVGLLVGATGVGKTETVRVLAEALHGQADAFCRIDMNTLAQDHYAAAITGAPPGYVGSKEGNTLFDTEKAQGSYSRPGIVLFDEIEKAGTEVLRTLLNLMDTGQLRLTSGNKTLDFRNSLIFMTSNLGARDILRYEQRFTHGWQRHLPDMLLPSQEHRRQKLKQLVDAAIEQKFDPEFINRIDQILLYNRIETHWLNAIIAIEVDKLNRRLGRSQWQLTLDSSARKLLSDHYDLRFGARSIRRAFKQHIHAALADYLLQPEGAPAPQGTERHSETAGHNPHQLTASAVDGRIIIS